jgi:hypothetical protein
VDIGDYYVVVVVSGHVLSCMCSFTSYSAVRFMSPAMLLPFDISPLML